LFGITIFNIENTIFL
jgi:hypothetical protein